VALRQQQQQQQQRCSEQAALNRTTGAAQYNQSPPAVIVQVNPLHTRSELGDTIVLRPSRCLLDCTCVPLSASPAQTAAAPPCVPTPL
jgi:hypothetical protein